MHVSKVTLTSEQIDKLRRVLNRTTPIYPSPPTSSFPTLHINPQDFLRQVFIKLKEHSIDISGVRLNGGAASYVLINDSDFVYRDIDVLFLIKTPLSSEQKTTLFSSNNEPYLCDVWTIIKYIISLCLIKYIPNVSTSTQYFVASVLDTYTNKNIKITSEQDSWALLSLQNLLGQNLELKFVENLKRQWQFSVDSFQLNLEPLLLGKPSNQRSTHTSLSTNKQTSYLVIEATNGVSIINKDKEINTPLSTSPLQFGSFAPLSADINENTNNIQCKILATITTIETSNNSSSESRPRSLKPSESTPNDDQSNLSFQFQLSLNEDVDDGIEADVGDSTNEDDDQVFRAPLFEVYSVYKDLHQALYHLNNRLIATYEAETMRGGGLLKYCDLLARNYKLYDAAVMIHMQRYMCSRFFIDYKTITEQIHVIAQYVATHFLPSSIISKLQITNNFHEILQHRHFQQNQYINSKYDKKQIDEIDLINARLCLLFFEHLSAIIQQSTVCLTPDDRELLLMNIHYLKEYYHYEYEHLFQGDNQHYQKYHVYNHHQHHHHQQQQQQQQHHHHGATSSSNSSRSSSPSNASSKSYGSYHRPNPHRNYYSQRQSTNPSYHGGRNYYNQQTVSVHHARH